MRTVFVKPTEDGKKHSFPASWRTGTMPSVASFAAKLLACAAPAFLAVPSAATTPPAQYPTMAPIDAYLMDRTQEIALAKSAAPTSISKHATILVLTRTGYETAVTGTNGFVCWVGRGWVGASDWPERWNP